MILETYGIKTSVGPAGGWVYSQPTDNGPVRIPTYGRAASDDKLVELVRDYRISNGISMGDPAYDVAEQIRKRSPHSNRWHRSKTMADKIRRADKTPANVPLIERIGNWLRWIAPRRPKLVSDYEAGERVPVCASCRHNVKWAIKCKPCIDRVIEDGQNVRQRLIAEKPDTLLACRLHELYLPTAVYIDRDHLPVRHPDAPEDCICPASS